MAMLAFTWAPHWLAAALACLLAGGAFYMLHTTLQTRATQMAPAGQRGSAVALFASCLFLGQSAGVAAVSMAFDRGAAAWAFSACAAALVFVGLRAGGAAARAG